MNNFIKRFWKRLFKRPVTVVDLTQCSDTPIFSKIGEKSEKSEFPEWGVGSIDISGWETEGDE